MTEASRVGADLAARFRSAARPLMLSFLPAGFPDAESCVRVAHSYVNAGADLVELGVPVPNPYADGPIIRGSIQRARARGTGPPEALQICRQLMEEGIGVVLLSYPEVIEEQAAGSFFRSVRRAGAHGVVVPGLTGERAEALSEEAGTAGIPLVTVVTPDTGEENTARLVQASRGFVYCAAVAGTTGPRSALPGHLGPYLEGVRRHTDLPLAVGFGISSPEQAGRVAAHADGIVMGSRLLQLLESGSDVETGLQAVTEFLRACRRQIDKAAADAR